MPPPSLKLSQNDGGEKINHNYGRGGPMCPPAFLLEKMSDFTINMQLITASQKAPNNFPFTSYYLMICTGVNDR
jgi:hypothetical protein